MTIAILGSDSFLAKHLIEALSRDRHVLTLFSRTTPEPFSFPQAAPSADRLAQFDAIILTASAGVQAGTKVTTTDLYSINLFYPVTLINELVERNYPGIVITFGSYFEIGNCTTRQSFNESQLVLTPHLARHPYSLSKRMLTRFRDSYNGSFPWFHLILPTIYGKGERDTRLIPYLIENARLQKNLSVTAGTQERQYLHVADVADFVSLALGQKVSPNIYNLAPTESTTIADLRATTIRIANPNYTGTIEIKSGRDEEMKFLNIDATRALQAGWKPCVSLESGIQSYLE